MKLRPVAKLDKRNTATSKKFEDAIMSANCDVTLIFSSFYPIWSYSEAGFGTHGL